jgi:hypothetical protein
VFPGSDRRRPGRFRRRVLRMYPLGQSRRSDRAPMTSGLPRLTDIFGVRRHVSMVPKAEVTPTRNHRWCREMGIALNRCAVRRVTPNGSEYSRTWSQGVVGIEAFLCGDKVRPGFHPLVLLPLFV